MRKVEALKLKPGAVVIYGESARGPATWWGRVRRVTERGGVLVAPFERHWSDAPPEPELPLGRAWHDAGPPERWIPCQWIYRAA